MICQDCDSLARNLSATCHVQVMPRSTLIARQIRRWDLPLKQLKDIIRAAENTRKLTSTPHTCPNAIARILKNKVTVDWAVIEAPIAPGNINAVDSVFRELIEKGFLFVKKIPSSRVSSPLTEIDGDQAAGPSKLGTPGLKGMPQVVGGKDGVGPKIVGVEDSAKSKNVGGEDGASKVAGGKDGGGPKVVGGEDSTGPKGIGAKPSPKFDHLAHAKISVNVSAQSHITGDMEDKFSFEGQVAVVGKEAFIDAQLVLKAWRETKSESWWRLGEQVDLSGTKRNGSVLFGMSWDDGHEHALKTALGYCWVKKEQNSFKYTDQTRAIELGAYWEDNQWNTKMFVQRWKSVTKEERVNFPPSPSAQLSCRTPAAIPAKATCQLLRSRTGQVRV
ncbi:hypothetical protein DFH06DRAFT_278722 [Mycena polygramma]|nr:hypothetical protein DFH06DRAFT_278722 [Mycena polygramma]